MAACTSGAGKDTLTQSRSFSRLPQSACLSCHGSPDIPAVNPLLSNGTGTSGKHVKHFSERRIDCEHCHAGYFNNPSHRNGVIDTGSPASALVQFSIAGATGSWTSTGPGSGACSDVACHGPGRMEWYGTAGWSLPACATCHLSTFSAALDPVSSNGIPPAGRHGKHVQERAIACERCHTAYPSLVTHMNGTFDTADPAVDLVNFDIAGPAATAWRNDSSECSSVACHGPDVTVQWYGTTTWSTPSDCTTCHKPEFSSSLTPTGASIPGMHTKHIALNNTFFICSKCHLDYPVRASHANGLLDAQNSLVGIVSFDSTNPTGTWVNDTGQETGECSNLFCHGAAAPAWYGGNGVTFDSCPGCHSYAIGSRRQILGTGGDFGANTSSRSHHVAGSNDPTSNQCRVCHDMSHHMGGTVYLASADTPSTSIAYNPASPSTAEPFCLGCHDLNGALVSSVSGSALSPFNDDKTLGLPPYRASVDVSADWNKTYGHRRKGLTCLGSGAPNTGCHANGHGTPNTALLAKNMTFPQPDRYRESDFALCFECHQSYPTVTKEIIFGVHFTEVVSGITITRNYDGPYGPIQNPLLRSDTAHQDYPPYNLPGGIQTHFRDQNYGRSTGKFYDDIAFWGNYYTNLHWFHISMQTWSYRGTTSSGISCTACHGVHGANTQWGMVHDQLGYNVAVSGLDSYGTMTTNLPGLGYPAYCSFNCHGVQGTTYNWYDPPNE